MLQNEVCVCVLHTYFFSALISTAQAANCKLEVLWKYCAHRITVDEQVHCRLRQRTASADVELLICCFRCAAGEDQVLHSALSATDLSRLAGGGCVPVQMVM